MKYRHRAFFPAYFWQTWLPTVQEVLQADWQEVWHSPQPPVCTVCCREAVLTVIMCFAIENTSFQKSMPYMSIYIVIIAQTG